MSFLTNPSLKIEKKEADVVSGKSRAVQFLSTNIIILGKKGSSYPKEKRCSFFFFTFDPDSPTMCFDNFFGVYQPNSTPRNFIRKRIWDT